LPLPYLVANLQEHPSLQEKVYDHLKQAILAGEIEPGERLLETRLAESLGVSRIPVREAIRKLEREGLIVVFPRRGVYASSLSPRDVDEVYAVRAVLEGLAARLAAEHKNDTHLARLDEILADMAAQVERGDAAGLFSTGREFHQVVLEAADNAKLSLMMELMRGQIERVRRVRMQVTGRTHDVLREYQAIRDAIARGDGKRAEVEMRAHVERPRKALFRMLHAEPTRANALADRLAAKD
jgi:DNA-binding GntR family transcriptional regulator